MSEPSRQVERIEPTPWQERVLQIPWTFDLGVLGGRGLGKSWLLAFLVLQFIERLAARARCLYLRRSLPSTLDFALVCRQIFGVAYGRSASFNANRGIWQFPKGGTLEIGELSDFRSIDRFTGRSIGLLLVDQVEQQGTAELVDLMRSNLRTEGGDSARLVVAAHPGGVGDAWLRTRYVLPSEPWVPFKEPVSGRQFVRTSGTWQANPHLSPDYGSQLEAATHGDEHLRAAWIEGDFIAGGSGSFFSGCFSEDRNVVEDWPTPAENLHWWSQARGSRWGFHLAMDWGSAAPMVCYLMATSPGGTGPDDSYYSRGSLLAIDETHTARPGSLTQGQGLTVREAAERIRAMCRVWKVEPSGCCDDACFAKTGHDVSLAEAFEDSGVSFDPAEKGSRSAGWEKMRVLLQQAGSPDQPGLFLTWRCRYALSTLPFVPRDRRNPEDLATDSADHACDALRYGCLYQPFAIITSISRPRM